MTTKKLNQQTEHLEHQARRTAASLREQARNWQQAALDRTMQLRDTTDNYVHHNPWSVIGLVALFSFTFGILAGNRRREYIIRR
jgi:ElaB/YqjD/DUF883 family membrane-anchored ribosome-binding protein